MHQIAHQLLVLSGKGGVGKSTVAANLAISLKQQGQRVGILDIDIHGPSIPRLFGVSDTNTTAREDETILPVEAHGLLLMSLGFMVRSQDHPIIWRGPRKHAAIKQLLHDVAWGELDYLVIDAPPGTGDEPLTICQLIPDADGAVIVTTPQDISVADVRRSISFCRALEIPVLGILENMSGFSCPACGAHTPIFKSGGGERLATETEIHFLGRIPLDPTVVSASDAGTPVLCEETPTSAAKHAFRAAATSIHEHITQRYHRAETTDH